MMPKPDEKCNFGNSYIFTITLDRDCEFLYSIEGAIKFVRAKFRVNCMLKCEISLPMFCTLSIGDLWHSYIGSSTPFFCVQLFVHPGADEHKC